MASIEDKKLAKRSRKAIQCIDCVRGRGRERVPPAAAGRDPRIGVFMEMV